MGVAFIAAVGVCTLEGLVGIALNLWLLIALVISKRRVMDRVYRIPIYVSAVQNLLLCILIATMSFVHIFREGTFVTVMLGPLSQFWPREVSVVAFQIALVLTTMMWTLIPVTATLQLMGLSSCSWPTWKRLSISLIFTVLCVIDVAVLSSHFVPTPEFNDFIEGIVRDLYKIEPNIRIAAVGSTSKYAQLNSGRSMLTLLLYLVLAPYILSYGFFISLVCLIRRRLTSHGVTLSARTLRMQRAFHMMQLMQASEDLGRTTTDEVHKLYRFRGVSQKT
ncbi:hypothetical protein PMAYCL1PPCAC_16384, partial [Pristionchus mayeri]